MQRIKLGWQLAKKSWKILKNDRSLVKFPLISAIATIGAAAIIFGPAVAITANNDAEAPLIVAGVIAAYCLTFIGIFFNVALVAEADRSINGEPASVGRGIAEARSRLGTIAGWALVVTTVGLLLRVLEERLGWIGSIATALLGVAWAIITFFVVPVIVFEKSDVKQGMKRSAQICKQRWGEQIVGNVSIGGLIVLLGILPSILVLVVGVALAASGQPIIGGTIAAIGVVALIVCVLVASTLTRIFGVVLYRYATAGQAVGTFTNDELQQAFKQKRSKRLFGRS